MAAYARSREQREAARAYIARRVVVRPSITLAELADELVRELPGHPHVSRQTICDDMAAVRERWIASQKESQDEARGRDLAMLDRIIEEAWNGWFRSLESRRTENVEEHTSSRPPVRLQDTGDASVRQVAAELLKQQDRGQRDSRKSGVRIEQRDGRPEFLGLVTRCLERRAAILGYDAPEQIDLTVYVRERAVALGLDPDEAERRVKPHLRLMAAS